MSNRETVFMDGSMGEGGGQILRTSLALSCITGRSLHIENIRASRPKPGLAEQHLACVRAACQICNGRCQGATLGSKVLDFEPGVVRAGQFSFEVASAGSASLVAQTVLPALFFTSQPCTVKVSGGTHNPLAPPFDFLEESFFPALASAGFMAECKLIKHGFYPAGGGKMIFQIEGWSKQQDRMINLCQANEHFHIQARIYTARLPAHIAQRQEKLLLRSKLTFEDIEHIDVKDSKGPGNCVVIRICGNRRTTVFTAFGRKGRPSHEVVREVVRLARDFVANRAAIDRFLADQLLIYMAIVERGCFTTDQISKHCLTNMEAIKEFLPVRFDVEQEQNLSKVSCSPTQPA